MANPDHFDIIKQGWKVWNKWREENPEIRPDLSGGGLSSKNLHRVNLNGADLSDADLFGANLSGADIIGADLSGADLRDASLRNADLRIANFRGANMYGAVLYNAMIGGTIFAGNDLSDINLLETAIHLGPSHISLDAVVNSKGKIPEPFLRGCGLQEWEIEAVKLYQPDLSPGRVSEILYRVHELRTNPAVQFHSSFISYSSKNHAFAEALYNQLQATGVRCWFAPEDIKIGDKFRQRIDEAVRIHDKLLLILSKESIASVWVEEEVESALEKERKRKKTVLFPIRIDDAVIKSKKAWAASLRRMRHIGDFSQWKDHDSYSKAFDRLLRDLKSGDEA